MRTAPPQRKRAQSQSPGLLPQGKLQRHVQNHRKLSVLRAESQQAANAMDEGSLYRG